MHLIVLSGLNSEGENIVFAVAIMQEIKYESFCWILFHFKQAVAKHESHSIGLEFSNSLPEEDDDTEPETVITTFH